MKHTTASKDASSPNRHPSPTAVPSTDWRKVKTHYRQCLFISLMTALVIPSRTGALTINATFDSTITSDPNAAAIEATINSAIAVYEADFSDPITVAFTFKEVTTGLASSLTYSTTVSYSDYITALTASATSADDAIALAHLPSGPNNPVNNNPHITLKYPLARALGFSASPPSGQPDSTISLNISIMNITSSNPDPNKYSLFAEVSHEMDEGLAFGGGLDGLVNGVAAPTDASVEPEDLFRYAQNGARSWTTDVNAASYFSLDGTTDLARFNQDAGGVKADFEDWYSPGRQTPQVQDAFGTPGAFPTLGVELRVLDAIGLTFASTYEALMVWVNFHYSGSPQNGTIQYPYSTLEQGVTAVADGGIIAINATAPPSLSSETISISKAMTIISVSGPSTIGQ
jgi:hypothetical protein